MKKTSLLLGICLLTICYLSFFTIKAEAGKFEQLAFTGFLYLNDDQKWEQKYNTSYGEFKIRFRKLRWAADERKYHLIIWWNNKRIADGYCPLNYEGYSFSVFHDQLTDRIFVSMETRAQINLFGSDRRHTVLLVIH